MFEANKVLLPDEKSQGLGTLTLGPNGLILKMKTTMKRYELSRISGVSQKRGYGNNKVSVELSNESDLRVQFGGMKGKKNADEFTSVLMGLLAGESMAAPPPPPPHGG